MTRKQEEVMIVVENHRLQQELVVEKAKNSLLEQQVITLQNITHSLLVQNEILISKLVD